MDHQAFAGVVGELSATVLGNFAVDDILRQLVLGVTQVLRDVDGAGVVVPSPSGDLLRLVFSSAGRVSELERLQEELQDGPCRAAHASGQIVTESDFAEAGELPAYRKKAVELGVRSATAVPLRARGRSWGVLDLYGTDPGALSDEQLRAAATLANLATSYLVVTADRDSAQRAKDEYAYRAMHDLLTGLPARWVFLEQLSHAISRLGRHPGTVALFFLDLDGLKYVNDTFGHLAGDQLITGCVQRIRSALRPDDILARLGGDEFVVLFETLPSPNTAATIAQRILEQLSKPLEVGDQVVQPSASLGIAFTSDPTLTADTLIAHADAAMYRAKHAGRGRFEIFDSAAYVAERDGASARDRLTSELQAALQGGQLEMHYQPIVDLRDTGDASVAGGAVYAVEALARWRHPRRGLLPAAQFIEAGMRSRLVSQLSAWAIGTACRQLATWDEDLQDRAPQQIFVNVSAEELSGTDLLQCVRSALADSGLAADRLTLEVTETGLMPEPEVSGRTLAGLRALGCTVAIDDFGTGYSSLSRLVQIPASTLKVDQSFTHHLLGNTDAAAVVSAVVLLGESLGRTVIVEGVESLETLDLLRSLGSTHVQGEYLARPMHPDQLTGDLRQQPWHQRV